MTREKRIIRTSIIGIVVNLILGGLKAVLGTLTGSVAIVSDAVNNLTDSSSSLITIIGTKLAQKRPDREHPYGHGRIEYLTSLTIGVIVVVTGIEMGIGSVKGIISPTPLHFSGLTIVILAITVATKVFLSIYTQRRGKLLTSGALTASGTDAMNDAIVSLFTIVSAVVFLLSGISIDAYAGVLISLFIIKTGLGTIRETINIIVGDRIDSSLRDQIIQTVESSESILSANDLIMHNYGPHTLIGSINVEVDHNKTVGELYGELHKLQIALYNRFHSLIVIGIYAVDKNSPTSRAVWEILSHYKDTEPHCLGCHGVVIDEKNRHIYCDTVLDFDCDRNQMEAKLKSQLKERFPDYDISVTIDSNFA